MNREGVEPAVHRGHESAIVEVGRSATALVVMLLSGLGYVTAEAAIDRRDRSVASNPAADASAEPTAPAS